jgi:hypothetical protein
MLSKLLLEWPKEASSQPVSNREVTSVVTEKPVNPLDSQARALKDSDTFEARWRERVKRRCPKRKSRSARIAPTRHKHLVFGNSRRTLVFNQARSGNQQCERLDRSSRRPSRNRRDLHAARFIDLLLPNPLRVSAQIFAPVLPGELQQNP